MMHTTVLFSNRRPGMLRMIGGLVLLWALAGTALAGTVTVAAGGSAIPSNTAPGCSATAWTALTGPSYAETNNNGGEISTGTIILNAPAGFEFNTAATVTVLITGNNTASRNINNLATGTAAAITSITASQITFTVTASSTRANTLTWQGIQVRPTQSSPQSSGNITSSGTATLNGVTAGTTSFGALTEIASNPVCSGSATSVTASPSLCVDDATIGTQAWSPPGNAVASDNVYATATATNSQITHYLKCTGYNFNIPSDATISGITVAVEDHSQRTIWDYAMQLVKAGTIQPTNYATLTRFATTDTYVSYGGSTNLWGNAWTPADINNANFGAAFAAQRGAFNNTDTAYVDHIRITIDYTRPPQPIAAYQMDETNWNGTAGEVADSSGNGNNAQAFNSATTNSATPAVAGSPGTCRYGVFDNGSTVTQGYVQTPLPNFTSNFTVTAWVRTADNTIAGQRILIDDQNNSGGYGLSLGDGGAGKLRFYSRAINPVILDSTYTLANNTWYFVAAVADILNSKRTIYVFDAAGALLNATSDAAAYTGTWGTDAGPVSIGGETNASAEAPASFHFHGYLDEVKVFASALAQSEAAQIAAQTHACPASALDHLEIQHATGSGLTCAASTLTIKACSDAACTAGYTGGVSGTLSASGAPTVNWDGTTGGATGAGFAIPAGSSSITKNVQVATAGSVVFGISAAAPAPTNATACNFGAPACMFTANTAGFIFSNNTTGNTYTIPAQVSGIATPTLYLRAVQSSTANPAVCTPAIAGQTVAVNMGYTCIDPASCQAGNLATINTTPVAAGGSAVSLSFDANGSAPITARYDDVGKIALDANATVTPFTGANAITLNGSSNAYVVAPHHFGFSGVTAGPIKAGNNFSATVTAYNGLATPTATPNFGKEATPESVALSFTKCQPSGGSPGAFSGSIGAFSNGTATAGNLIWNEVGNGDLAATLASGNYLGSGLTASGNTGTSGTLCNTTGNVGRFIPDHFDTIVDISSSIPMPCPNGLTCPPCPNGGLNCPPKTDNGFVYSGQPFTVNIYARSLSGSTTQNYDNTLGYSKAVTLSAWDGSGSTNVPNPGNGDTLNNSGVLASQFNNGVAVVTPSYTFGSATTTAPTGVYLRAAEAPGGDGVTSNRGISLSQEGGVEVVSGRIKLSNAHGSELLPLPIAATVQYWNGTSYVTSATDNASSLAASSLNFANCQPLAAASTWPTACPPPTTASPASVMFASGRTQFTLSAPGAGNSGSVDVSINIPSYLPSNTARATFGVYGTNNRFIYQREQY